MDKMLDIIENQNARMHEDRQLEREHMRLVISETAASLRSAARDVVAPIGSSAATFSVAPGNADFPEVDVATADAIRQTEPVEVSDILSITIRVEGYRDGKRVLFAFDPEDPMGMRTFPVEIIDPALPEDGGVYRSAFVERSPLTLTGKTTRSATGQIARFHAIAGAIQGD